MLFKYGITLLVGLSSCSTLRANGAEILVVLPLPSRSHFSSFQPMLDKAIEKGHHLTLVSFHKLNEKYKQNYTHIDLSTINFPIPFASYRKQTRLMNLITYFDLIIKYMDEIFGTKSFQEFLERKPKPKFDVVCVELFFQDVLAILGHYFDAPVIGLSAQNLISFYGWNMGNPLLPSYIPNIFLPFTDKMSFIERTSNALFTLVTGLYYEYYFIPNCYKSIRDNFSKYNNYTIPSNDELNKILKNISLALVNDHQVLSTPKPNLPNVIEVAGLHIQRPSPLSVEGLPRYNNHMKEEELNKLVQQKISSMVVLKQIKDGIPDLQRFMDSSTNGMIYISFGSLIQPTDMNEMGITIIEALKNVPQNVLLKWDRSLLRDIPPNFLVQDWIPQISILNHPNCKVFVTHGGLHSLLESIHFSVPLVGIPFFTDQQHNIALVERAGTGVGLSTEFIPDQLSQAVNEVVNNPRYQDNMNLRSRIFRDRPINPVDTAIYWLEYVIRYKGADLEPASLSLAWYQYILLDVILFVSFLVFLTFWIAFVFMKLLLVKFQILFKKIQIIGLKFCSSIKYKRS